MSRIARKLCDEIVECPLKHSSRDQQRSSKSFQQYPSPSTSQLFDSDSKTTRTIVVEKKRVINNWVPNNSSASRTKFKSKETLLRKSFIDTAVNTTVTGLLRCDNNCVTLVRNRDDGTRRTCKCAPKNSSFKVNAKEIQTYDIKHFTFTDKASAQCVEMVNCGTQFLETLSDVIHPQEKIVIGAKAKKLSRDIEQTDMRQANFREVDRPYEDLRRIYFKQQGFRQEISGQAECRQADKGYIDSKITNKNNYLKQSDCKWTGETIAKNVKQKDLIQADISTRDFRRENLKLANKSNSDLKMKDFRPENLRQADMSQRDLMQKDFRQEDLRLQDISKRDPRQIYFRQEDNEKKDSRHPDLKDADLRHTDCLQDNDFRHTERSFNRSKSLNLNYMGARRWALSHYSTRGPDF